MGAAAARFFILAYSKWISKSCLGGRDGQSLDSVQSLTLHSPIEHQAELASYKGMPKREQSSFSGASEDLSMCEDRALAAIC